MKKKHIYVVKFPLHMTRLFLVAIFVVFGSYCVHAQHSFPCKPDSGISYHDFEQTIVQCPEVRRIVGQSQNRQLTVLLKNGGISTYSFKQDSLSSVENLWTYNNRKLAEETFYKVYEELLNGDATPISFSADKEESRIIAETETERFHLSMQDMLQPHVIVVLVIENLH